jgi:hypothetical protein
MKKLFTQITFVSLLTMTLFACNKSSDTTVVNNTPVTATVKDVMADTVLGLDAKTGMPYSAGIYTFFNIEKNTIISSTDTANGNWDLAFKTTKILINGGTSGNALGGAFIYNGLFDDLKTIPADSVFKVDNAPSSFAITYVNDNGWYHYDYATNIVTPIPGRILVIRTAKGKYAKIEITSYCKGGINLTSSSSFNDILFKQRYYNFKLTYQPNGTKIF